MDMSAVIGISVIAVVFAVILRQYRPEYGVLISIVTGIIILTIVMEILSPALERIEKLASMVGMGGGADILVKALGICFITQIALDTCKDAGETAIGSKVELAGKAAVVILTLPLFENLIEIALELMG